MLDTLRRICPVLWICRIVTALENMSALDGAVRQLGLLSIIRVDQGSRFTLRELAESVVASAKNAGFSSGTFIIDMTEGSLDVLSVLQAELLGQA